MKNNKPLALILFGIAVLLFAKICALSGTAVIMVAVIAAPVGLFISLVGLLWALYQR